MSIYRCTINCLSDDSNKPQRETVLVKSKHNTSAYLVAVKMLQKRGLRVIGRYHVLKVHPDWPISAVM